jgi:hypothetical protein
MIDNKDNSHHNMDMLHIRTNMPFYLPSILNKLKIIKKTFKNQKLDFLLVDDKDTLYDKKDKKRGNIIKKGKHSSIKEILDIILGVDRYDIFPQEFDKDIFTGNKSKNGDIMTKEEFISSQKSPNIRNSNFILLDFILDPIEDGGEGIFFGSDFIESIERLKKEQDEQFRSWYFITSYLSDYVNKFEIDKIIYEYYDSATVHLGDSSKGRFKIFFIKKIIYFIYSKVNIYIRIIKITKELKISNLESQKKLIKKLISLMRMLQQEVDLLELRYGAKQEIVNIAEQFYILSINILEDYIEKIHYKLEVKEIKLQELNMLCYKLSPKTNEEIKNIISIIDNLPKDNLNVLS